MRSFHGYILIAIIGACLYAEAFVFGVTINEVSVGWKILRQDTVSLNIYSECKNVRAPNGYDIFVPTKTLIEWNAFKNGVSAIGGQLSNCADPNLPTLNVVRTPAGGVDGTPYTVQWFPTNATTVTLECAGGRVLPLTTMNRNGGTSSGTYNLAWSGTTNCIWKATNSYGTTTVNESYTVIVTPYIWEARNRSSCSKVCGGGIRTQDVVCVVRNIGTIVDDSNCTGTKPPSTVSCNTQTCTYNWQVSNISACSANCGGGTQTRTIQCVGYEGVVNDSYCTAAKPSNTVSCNTQTCPFYGCTPNTAIDWDGNRIICDSNGQPAQFWRPVNPSYAMFGNPIQVNVGCQQAIVQPYIPDYNQCWYAYEYIAPYWAYVNFACNNSVCIMRSQLSLGTQQGYSSMPYIGTR